MYLPSETAWLADWLTALTLSVVFLVSQQIYVLSPPLGSPRVIIHTGRCSQKQGCVTA